VTVTCASTYPPHAIELGDPATRVCEAVAEGELAAGATPVAAPASTSAQSAPTAPRRVRLIVLPTSRIDGALPARRDSHAGGRITHAPCASWRDDR
jgi:hypothetical protein